MQAKVTLVSKGLVLIVLVILGMAAPSHAAAPRMEQREVQATSTYHSIGLTWHASGESSASVRFRPAGTTTWEKSLPLWGDGSEYRGSIINLKPNTVYQIELTSGSTRTAFSAKTRNENFPVARIITLPARSTFPINITGSGSPTGWVLYKPREQASMIEIDNSALTCATVRGSYIIVQGIVCRGAQQHGITVEDSHDVVIQNSDISGWGRAGGDGFGLERDSGIAVIGSVRVTVQRNRIHHPRYDTNSWRETNSAVEGGTCDSQECHPNGPQAVTFFNDAGGNHVVRYNLMWGDAGHYFSDAIQASSGRGPFADNSDFYNNRIAHVWDNAIQAEGTSVNTRIWGNYTTLAHAHIATASDDLQGPVYGWDNVAGVCTSSPGQSSRDAGMKGRMFKTGGPGPLFLWDNVALQSGNLGCPAMIDNAKPMGPLFTHNNIFVKPRT